MAECLLYVSSSSNSFKAEALVCFFRRLWFDYSLFRERILGIAVYIRIANSVVQQNLLSSGFESVNIAVANNVLHMKNAVGALKKLLRTSNLCKDTFF